MKQFPTQLAQAARDQLAQLHDGNLAGVAAALERLAEALLKVTWCCKPGLGEAFQVLRSLFEARFGCEKGSFPSKIDMKQVQKRWRRVFSQVLPECDGQILAAMRPLCQALYKRKALRLRTTVALLALHGHFRVKDDLFDDLEVEEAPAKGARLGSRV